MTSSVERRPFERPSAAPLGDRWRAECERLQESVLPSGRLVVSCSAPFGIGGLGRHLSEVVDALHRRQDETLCICGSAEHPQLQPRRRGRALADPASVLGRGPIPLSPGLRTRAAMVEFDAYAARRLPSAEHLIAFNGQALIQFRVARRERYQSISLVSANSHIRQVARRHAEAHRRYPIEGSWARHLLRRNLAEYARADRIYVASEYTRQSFIEEGFDEASLSRFRFTPDPRYRQLGSPRPSGTFNVVYVGSLTVAKGVTLLVDAFRRLPYADLRLALVGGWATRGMRRFIERARSEDARISCGPGDPLAHLQAASLYVHPSYEDGFAYAPAEALACGVPLLVTEDTGMKELIASPRTGRVLPTGDLETLSDAIEAAYRGELFDA